MKSVHQFLYCKPDCWSELSLIILNTRRLSPAVHFTTLRVEHVRNFTHIGGSKLVLLSGDWHISNVMKRRFQVRISYQVMILSWKYYFFSVPLIAFCMHTMQICDLKDAIIAHLFSWFLLCLKCPSPTCFRLEILSTSTRVYNEWALVEIICTCPKLEIFQSTWV